MRGIKSFLVSTLVAALALPIFSALPVSAAEVALTLKVVNAPTVMHEDFTFEVATANGSDISNALQGRSLGFSFERKDGREDPMLFDLDFTENELYSVQDLGSKYLVTVDVTPEGESGFEVVNIGGFPSVNQVSVPFDDTNYVLQFGEYVSVTVGFGSTTHFIDSMVETEFGFVTRPSRMEVFPSNKVNPGNEMYVIVYDADGNVTALPGDYYMSLFDTSALTSVGTSIDGAITESVLEGLYYFDAPNKLGNYRINLGPLALVPRTASFDFSVVSGAVVPFNPQTFSVDDFDYEAVDLTDRTIPQNIADLFGDDDADPLFLPNPGINVDPNPDLDSEVNIQTEVAVINEVSIPDVVFEPGELVERLPDIVDDVVQGQGNEERLTCADLKESFWAYEIINSLLQRSLYPVQLLGGNVQCRAEKAVTRKEFTVWLLRAYYPADVADIQSFHEDFDYDDSPFSDVDGDDVYDPYIVMAAEKGIVSGNPDGTFRPNNVINRAEVLKILLRSSELFEATAGQIAALDQAFDPVGRFVDEDNDDWYTPYLHYAVEAEIIEGRTEMRNGRMVRVSAMADGVLFGEAAKILYLARQ